MNDLERELEFELHQLLDPISRAPIPPRRAMARANYVQRMLGGAGGALAIKVLTGVAVAAAAATVATAAATGTANPSQWSQGISTKVHDCRAALGDQNGGIGQCVSVIAQHHGSNATNDESHHGNAGGNGNGNGSGGSNGQGHSQGKDNGKSKDQNPPKGK